MNFKRIKNFNSKYNNWKINLINNNKNFKISF